MAIALEFDREAYFWTAFHAAAEAFYSKHHDKSQTLSADAIERNPESSAPAPTAWCSSADYSDALEPVEGEPTASYNKAELDLFGSPLIDTASDRQTAPKMRSRGLG